MATQRPPTIDPIAAQRWLHAAPAVAPWLHEEVARRMQERLQWIKLQPTAWADWGAVRGGTEGHALVAQRFPNAACYWVDAEAEHTNEAIDSIAKPWWNPAGWRAAKNHVGPPPDAAVQMVWANMALHLAADPQALIGQWHRALATDGFLMFSCLGPDTVREIRQLYAEMQWPEASHQFTDMHDWGDMLVQAGFAEPVMDVERMVLTFDSPERLLQELRGLGRNLHPARFGALRGRQWHAHLLQEMALRAHDGRLPLTMEIIYGHAFKPQPRVRVAAQSEIPLTDMRAMLRAPPVPRS